MFAPRRGVKPANNIHIQSFMHMTETVRLRCLNCGHKFTKEILDENEEREARLQNRPPNPVFLPRMSSNWYCQGLGLIFVTSPYQSTIPANYFPARHPPDQGAYRSKNSVSDNPDSTNWNSVFQRGDATMAPSLHQREKSTRLHITSTIMTISS